jgi:outer membrane lipoprotein-sorting protein
MMQMMFAINRNNFKGQREVTCYSCHRGAPTPDATPDLASQLRPGAVTANSEGAELPTNLPTTSQLLDRYIEALGGAAAIEKITSRVETGTASFRGQSVGLEIFTQAPDKRALVQHLPQGDSLTVFDGHTGWVDFPGRPTRAMQGAEILAAQMDADLHFALRVQEMFPEVHVEYPEKVGDREAYVLLCVKGDQPAAKLYFDEQSNLLLRAVRYADSPLGLDPTQIDYADYRDVDGVQVPFRVTVSQPGSSSTIQIEQVQQNVAIDDTRFAKPASDRSHTAPAPLGQSK